MPGTDFSDKDVEAAKIVAKALVNASEQKINDLVDAELLKEICNA